MTYLHDGPAVKSQLLAGVKLPDPAVKSPPRLIIGTKLQLKLPTLSATFRALIGHELQSGMLAMSHYSPRQSAMITETPMALIRTIAAATPLQLAAMQRGDLDVEALHEEQLHNKRLSDVAVDRLVLEIGLDRVLAALDRLTRPATNGAAVSTNGHAADHANDNDGRGGAALPAQLSL